MNLSLSLSLSFSCSLSTFQTEHKVPEVTDGSCLSRQPIKNNVRAQGADPNRNKSAVHVSRPAASLTGAQSEY